MYFNLCGIQTHETLSCAEKKTVKVFLISVKGINLHQKHLKPNGIQAHETLSCTKWWTVKVLK